MKVFIAMGTRPEAIKLAPVIMALRGRAETILCCTGQHAELCTDALMSFGLRPDISLPAVTGPRTLTRLMATLLEGLDTALQHTLPDWMVVQGDTNSAFAATLAAFYRGIAVAHVEAGLRTGDLAGPFPEEGNRAMLAQVARLHFAPTRRAEANLLGEGIAPARIVVSGNTIVDAVALMQSDATRLETNLELPGGPLVLVSCHRRENQGSVLAGICAAIRRLAQHYPRHTWLFPMHPDPAIRSLVEAELAGISNILLRPPLTYGETLHVLSRCELVVTDSGGLQEEVAAFYKPVVVMREHTERPEGVEAGFASLAGRDPTGIEAAVCAWLDDPARRSALVGKPNPYGDGNAAGRIVEALLAAGEAAQ